MIVSMNGRTFVLLLVAVLSSSCTPDGPDTPKKGFERLSASRTNIDFTNQVTPTPRVNAVTHPSVYNGAGVGLGDINGDGRPDVFLASNMGTSRLYVNEGGMRFREVTQSAGIDTEGKWANGVAFVDINHDGHTDIYVSCGGLYARADRRANELYVNQGDGTFTEMASAYGLADTGRTTQTVFFDYDQDGDLDAYLLTNGFGDTGPNQLRPQKKKGQHVNTDKLYRNNGEGMFSEVSKEAGIRIEGNGLGVGIFDVNRDGWPDVYVANDYLSNDLLYMNNRDGTFKNRVSEYFQHQSYAAMGTDIADVNNDGWFDVLTVEMMPPTNQRLMTMYASAGYERNRKERKYGYDLQVTRNTLQLNNGPGPNGQLSFSEIGQLAGVHATDWSWSPLLADFDNDGWTDLFVTTGLPRDIMNLDFTMEKMRLFRTQGYTRRTKKKLFKEAKKLEEIRVHNYLFQNEGDLTFRDRSAVWGMDRPSISTGAAYGDLDGDGDLDLIVNNVNGSASVYQNRLGVQDGNYLKVRLKGPSTNPDGVGAVVTTYAGGVTHHRRQQRQRGYKSSMSSVLHFGIGSADTIDSVTVTWNDGRRQSVEQVPSNQVLRFDYGDSEPHVTDQTPERVTLFEEVSQTWSVDYRHDETHYNDFRSQPLLHHKYSQNGPGLAVGDVNEDGLDDFYVGGAPGQSGRLYLQQNEGIFSLGKRFSPTSNYDEMGALFFDANGDGHQDLYVASGGSEFEVGSEYYEDRLLFGDGTGNFQPAPNALPPLTTSSSVVAAADYDRDGDLDLFVGSRVVPKHYPTEPESHLLENEGGTFSEVTKRDAPALRTAGLVTGALWTDINKDGWLDLIVVGEWMPITVFVNDHGQLTEATKHYGLADTVGWWNSITGADFDEDGVTEYVAGSLGLNTWLKNSRGGPVQMHAGDYNKDGNPETILSRVVNGTRYPVHFRDNVLDEIPSWRKRFPTYESYANANLQTLLGPHLATATTYESDTFRSSYLNLSSDSTFDVRSLPIRAQFAPVFGLATGDYDQDGHVELLTTGNSYATEAFIGRYDAYIGALFEVQGDSLSYVDNSGFHVEGDAKALANLRATNGWLVLAARNDGKLSMFQPTPQDEEGQYRRAQAVETHAVLFGPDERTRRVEFYRGSGYLSQSSRIVYVPESVDRVVFYKGDDQTRMFPAHEN